MLKGYFFFFLSYLAFFLLLSSCSFSAFSQPFKPFVVVNQQDDYGRLTGNVYMLKAENIDYKVSEIIEKYDQFERYHGEELLNEHIYWFALQIENRIKSNIELFLEIGYLDFYEVYPVVDGAPANVIKGGGLRPAWELTYPNNSRLSIPLEIGESDTNLYLIKVTNSEFMTPVPIFNLFGSEGYESLKSPESAHLLQGIFHGVLWVMIIYNIFFAFIGRDKTYWYYALYMITISLYFLNISGYLTKYLYPDHPEYGRYVWLIMQTATIFYIIFIRKFLDLQRIHPRWHKISRYLLYALIGFVVFKASYFLIFKQYGILSYLSQVVLFLGVVFTGGLIYSLIHTKNKLAQYFTIGSVALGVGLLSASIIAFSGRPFSREFFSSIQIGVVFEIIFFSIGLSYKMRESERDKIRAQEDLVDQMKKNEKLQLEYQYELEQKVVERTTQIEQQKEILEEQKYRLEEVNDEKNHLIGILAHDLRNPLTSALSMAQLLKSEEEDKDKSEMGGVVVNSLKRMNDMIGKILDIKAIESQVIKFDKVIFDMGEESHRILEQFKGKAKQKAIKVHEKLDESSVCVDKNYFVQIVENLISNAIKFSPAQTNIYISSLQVDGKSILEICDEGPGFSAEDKKKVFGKYQKLSARPTGNESSTGIGLSIVKKYVEAMDGTITLNSESGKGATFRIEFTNV